MLPDGRSQVLCSDCRCLGLLLTWRARRRSTRQHSYSACLCHLRLARASAAAGGRGNTNFGWHPPGRALRRGRPHTGGGLQRTLRLGSPPIGESAVTCRLALLRLQSAQYAAARRASGGRVDPWQGRTGGARLPTHRARWTRVTEFAARSRGTLRARVALAACCAVEPRRGAGRAHLPRAQRQLGVLVAGRARLAVHLARRARRQRQRQRAPERTFRHHPHPRRAPLGHSLPLGPLHARATHFQATCRLLCRARLPSRIHAATAASALRALAAPAVRSRLPRSPVLRRTARRAAARTPS